jgi:CRISPR-associated exonuclease Cas4
MDESSIRKTWSEADMVMISALQHWSYCPRQCGLIHLDQAWDENLYTLRGRAVHALVDAPDGEWEGAVRVERALPLWSERVGLVGRADVVEFHEGVPFPIEYKHGPRRKGKHDELQLAAQAVCLEEMFAQPVPGGAIYHHGSRRRREVAISPALRIAVVEATVAVRSMLRSRRLPVAVNDARCEKCSLRQSCLPTVTDQRGRIERAMRSLFVVDAPERVSGAGSC